MDITATGQWIESDRQAKTEAVRIDVDVVTSEEVTDRASVQLTLAFGHAESGTARCVEVYLPVKVARTLADRLCGYASDAERISDDDMTDEYSS